MKREEALKLIESKIKDKKIIKHMVATEACMKALAKYLEENETHWGLAGLLHDLDYEETINDLSKHGLITEKILTDLGVNAQVTYAIKAHTGQVPAKSSMAKALYSAIPLVDSIIDSILTHPSKSLRGLDTEFVLNYIKEKFIAKGSKFNKIQTCVELGITLHILIKFCLEAMQSIAQDLEA